MAIFRKIEKASPDSHREGMVIPRHIGIIMDGNGRWAKKRMLPRSAGHRAGAERFKEITFYSASIGVEVLTVYAFSTENWSRPQEEVGALMGLFKQYLREALTDFLEENIQVRFLGDTSAFNQDLQELIREIKEVSAAKTGMILNLAMNYGGRAEILRAARELALQARDGSLDPDAIDESLFARQLYTHDEPDPDLIIRPSGEQRLSNFLLWQAAYAEFVYFDILWPDFQKKDLDEAIRIYNSRQRRFGGV